MRGDIQWQLRKQIILRRLSLPTEVPQFDSTNGVVLFFAPEAGVSSYFTTICVLARTLQELGHQVLVTRCFQLLPRCAVKSAFQLPLDCTAKRENKLCLRCSDESFRKLDAYDLPSIDLRALLSDEVLEKVSQSLADAPDSLLDFQFDSIPFGRLCTVELSLATKVHDFENVSPPQRTMWLKFIESSMLAYMFVDQICRHVPVSWLVYHNDYSVNIGVRCAAEKHGVAVSTVVEANHKNVDYGRYLIFPKPWVAYGHRFFAAWPRWRDMPADPFRVKEVTDDLLFRVSGKATHVYSPGKTFQSIDLRTKMELSTEKKLLVAYTSSLDELIACRMQMDALGVAVVRQDQAFEDQIEWLDALTVYVAARDDLQLIVRVHPREGANHREPGVSQHLGQLREAFDRHIQNCRFVWPGDPVSSYDLGEIADVALTGWSSIGVELARLGVPVLAAFNIPEAVAPVEDFLRWVPTREEYFKTIHELLDEGPSLQRVLHAFRWSSFFNLEMALAVNDLIPRSDFAGLPDFKLPREAKSIEDAVIHGEQVIEINHRRRKSALDLQSEVKELTMLRQQLGRIVHFLLTGEDCQRADLEPNAATLTNVKPVTGDGLSLAGVRGADVEYRIGKKRVFRYSPMIARLHSLCANRHRPEMKSDAA